LTLLLVLMVATVVLAPVAERIAIPYPVLLLMFGLVLAFVPGLPLPAVNPELLLPLVLPPLLFAAARRTSWREFLDNRRPIALLAVALVAVTAFAVGMTLQALVPGLPLIAALALGAGVVTIRGHGHDVLLDSGDIGRLLLGTIVMAALWAALGVGVGGVLRNQVLTIVGLFGWVFVIETLLLRHLPDVGRYAPGAAGTAVTGDTVGDSTVDLLAPVTGGVLLAAYALVFVVAGAFVTSRRDIT